MTSIGSYSVGFNLSGAFILTTPGFTIYGSANTAAQSYANTYHMNFVDTGTLFTGGSLSLQGDVGVNLFVDFEDENSLNLTEEEVEQEVEVNLSWTVNGTEKTSSATLTANDKTEYGYKVSCSLPAAEMNSPVTLTFVVDTVEQNVSQTYSVADYAETVLTDDDFINDYTQRFGAAKYNDLTSLVKSMLDYGAKSQIYFNRNTDSLANEKLVTDNTASPYYYNPAAVDPDSIVIQNSDMTEDLAQFGLEYVGTTVVFLSETTLRHYYRITDKAAFNNVIATFNDYAVRYKTHNGMIYFGIKNISASELDNYYTIAFFNGREVKNYNYSVLDYLRVYTGIKRPCRGDIPLQHGGRRLL